MKHSDSGRYRLLVALKDSARDQFIDKAVWKTLYDHFDVVDVIDPSQLTTDQWNARFERSSPHALLSGWGCKMIPVQSLPGLQFVAHTTGSVRTIVTREMIEAGLRVTNWGPMAAPTVAEHALTLTLAAMRRLPFWTRNFSRRGPLDENATSPAVSLYGKRVGLHGFGLIARHFVQLIQPFGCRITAFSEGVPDTLFVESGVLRAASLASLFDTCDVLIEMESLTDSSCGSVTADLITRLPEGATFINVGRSQVVDNNALLHAARSGRVHVGLDVFDTEPLPNDSAWRDLDNVILTPHIAGPTVDHRRRCGRRAVEQLVKFATDEELHDLITLDVFDRST